MTTRDWLKNMVAAHIPCDGDKITDEADLGADLGADSLDRVEFVMEAEEHFGVHIEDSDAGTILIFGDLVRMVERARR